MVFDRHIHGPGPNPQSIAVGDGLGRLLHTYLGLDAAAAKHGPELPGLIRVIVITELSSHLKDHWKQRT